MYVITTIRRWPDGEVSFGLVGACSDRGRTTMEAERLAEEEAGSGVEYAVQSVPVMDSPPR